MHIAREFTVVPEPVCGWLYIEAMWLYVELNASALYHRLITNQLHQYNYDAGDGVCSLSRVKSRDFLESDVRSG